MNLLQLKYFKKVAELEHMSKAAKELMISQPALTKTIRHLEEELASSLFDHSGNAIILNEKGKIALQYTNRILQNAEDLYEELQSATNSQQKTLNIGVKAAAALIPKYVLGFRKLFPDISLNITQTNFDIHDPKALQKFDYILFSSITKSQNPNTIELLKEPCVMGFPSDHPATLQRPFQLASCSQERFLILRDKTPISDLTLSICQDAGFTPRIDLTCDSWDTIYSLIEAEIGIALLPSYTWNVSKTPYAITTCNLPNPQYRYLQLLWKEESLSESALLFQQYLVSFFHELDLSKVD